MAAPYTDIESKVEAAFKAILDADASVTALLTVRTGLDDDKLTLPAVVCHCSSAQEDPPNCGNYWCEADVIVQTSLDRPDGSNPTEDRLAAHRANVATVRDSLCTDDLATRLNAVGIVDFTCQLALQQNAAQTTENNTAVSVKTFRCLCSPSTIA